MLLMNYKTTRCHIAEDNNICSHASVAFMSPLTFIKFSESLRGLTFVLSYND